MTVSLETTKTAQLVVVRGDVIVRGPFAVADREAAQRGVAITNEQLGSLGLEPDAQLAEVTATLSYGKPKIIQPDEAVTTDGDTPNAGPVIDPAGPAAASPSALPVTPPSAA